MFEWICRLMISFLELSDTRTNCNMPKHTNLLRKIPNRWEIARNGDRLSLKRFDKVMLVDALQAMMFFHQQIDVCF